MRTNIHFCLYLTHFFLQWEIFQSRNKIKTYFIFNNFSFENGAVNEIRWKNTVDPDRSKMTIRRMRIAWCTPKATNTHLEYKCLMLLHYNNSYAKALQYYFTYTLPPFLKMCAYARRFVQCY